MAGNFFGGQFFGGGFFGALALTAAAGHGQGDEYDEPRRVIIDGKPYTVRSKSQYLGLLARSQRDKARESAEVVIARSQQTAKDSLETRRSADVAETASLLHDLLAREAKKKPKTLLPLKFEEDAIPMEILMLVAADL